MMALSIPSVKVQFNCQQSMYIYVFNWFAYITDRLSWVVNNLKTIRDFGQVKEGDCGGIWDILHHLSHSQGKGFFTKTI